MATDAGVDGVECDGHSSVQGVDMSDCQRCKVLEAEVAALRHRIVSLNRIISDMSGPAALELDDDPYEDEQPMIRGREDR